MHSHYVLVDEGVAMGDQTMHSHYVLVDEGVTRPCTLTG